jgi:hypothetical protein
MDYLKNREYHVNSESHNKLWSNTISVEITAKSGKDKITRGAKEINLK